MLHIALSYCKNISVIALYKFNIMYLFMKEKKLNLGIRVSTENFSHYNPIDTYPLYVVENIIND